MTTISDEHGIINNFANEPAMYYAEAPSTNDKKVYIIWGAIALCVVTASIFTATFVS